MALKDKGVGMKEVGYMGTDYLSSRFIHLYFLLIVHWCFVCYSGAEKPFSGSNNKSMLAKGWMCSLNGEKELRNRTLNRAGGGGE